MFSPCFTVLASSKCWPQHTTTRATRRCRTKRSTPLASVTSTNTDKRERQSCNHSLSIWESPKTPRKGFEDVKLILAPMEVLADHQFRKAIATIGGMHEAVHEFIRITDPKLENIHGVLRRRYNFDEMGSIPLAAQIMGGDPTAMGLATRELVYRYGARRVDLNCGCPAKRANGRGAGASLLRSPESIYEITKSMVDAVGSSDAVVSVKMRSGFNSTILFNENVCAVIEAGARILTVHPRTKQQGYSGRADWDLIKRAKEICKDSLQVVGNGDVTTAEDAIQLLSSTGCDHVMVGRGAVANPWIFWDIREALANLSSTGQIGKRAACHQHTRRRSFEAEQTFYESYFHSSGPIHDLSSQKIHKMKIGRLKMIVGYSETIPQRDKEMLLRSDGGGDARGFLKEVILVLGKQYE